MLLCNVVVFLKIGARPRVIVEEPREVVELRVGGTLEIRCSAEGSPRPQVTWTYGPNRELPVNVSPLLCVIYCDTVYEVEPC